MLQAMNTGHEGSLTTIHANTPRDALGRLETMVAMAQLNLPEKAVRQQIASAINVIVQTERLRGGGRKIVGVAEVFGLKEGEIGLNELFAFRQVSVTPDGRAVGYHTATGTLSTFQDHFKANGTDLPESMFEPSTQPPQDKLY